MFNVDKITLDPKSGRPTPSVFWKMTTFFLIFGWVMALIMAYLTWLAVRDNQPGIAITSAFTGLLAVSFIHWRRRQIRQAQARYSQMLAGYERRIAQPPF